MNLANKVRPVTLDDIAGQDVAVRMIRRAFETDRIAPAYLCVGKHGTGKTTSARIMARMLLCKAREPNTTTLCGTCLNCKESLRGACPDIQEFDAGDLGKEGVKTLKSESHYRPMFGDYKVYIIDEVHNLSFQGFQALLKILEEPPAYVRFILATTEFSKVPKTILSRCQVLRFSDLSHTIITERLTTIAQAENLTISPEMLDLVARLGEGSMRNAIAVLDAVITNGYTQSSEIHAHFEIPTPEQVKQLAIPILQGDTFAYAKVLTQLEVSAKLNLAECYKMLLDHLSHRLIDGGAQGSFIARHLMYLMGAQSLFLNSHLKARQVFDTIVMRVVDELEPYRTPAILQELGACA